MIVNTGQKRSVVGHTISGGIIAFMLGGAYAYKKYRTKEVSKQEAIAETLKATMEGGILSACGIAAANALGNGAASPMRNLLEATTFIAVGIAGVYAIQAMYAKPCANVSKFTQKDKYDTTQSK